MVPARSSAPSVAGAAPARDGRPAGVDPAAALRRFHRGLLLLLALAAASQVLIASEAFSGNPMVLVPQVDAAVVWSHAGEIAGGALVDDAPFETAPLTHASQRRRLKWPRTRPRQKLYSELGASRPSPPPTHLPGRSPQRAESSLTITLPST